MESSKVYSHTADDEQIFKLIMDKVNKSNRFSRVGSKVGSRVGSKVGSGRVKLTPRSRSKRKQYLRSIKQAAVAKIKSIRLHERATKTANRLKIKSDKARARARAYTLKYMILEENRLNFLRSRLR